MLNEHGAEFHYREYTAQPLSKAEIRKVVKLLGVSPRDVLRKNDKAYKQLGLDGSETDTKLIALMAEHPTLLQRPIAVAGDRAVVGRPVDDVALEIGVEHTWVGDLTIKVVSPTGTVVTAMNRPGAAVADDGTAPRFGNGLQLERGQPGHVCRRTPWVPGRSASPIARPRTWEASTRSR